LAKWLLSLKLKNPSEKKYLSILFFSTFAKTSTPSPLRSSLLILYVKFLSLNILPLSSSTDEAFWENKSSVFL
jgi:hypothetical protein